MSASTRRRILFVDDEPMVLLGLAATLRKHFDVVTAPNAAAALALLASDSAFSVIVSDYRMSGMNGAALLAGVRERYPAIVRILLTGAGAEGDDVKSGSDLVFQLLSKPCPRATLIRALEDAVYAHDHVSPHAPPEVWRE